MDSWPSIPQILTRAYGDAEGARILKSGRDAIEHSESAVFRSLRNLSTQPRVNDPPAAFVMVVRTEIEPGTSVSCERLLSKLKAAQEQEQGTRTVNRSVLVLGPALIYLGANFFNKHADRDNWSAVPDLRVRHTATPTARKSGKEAFAACGNERYSFRVIVRISADWLPCYGAEPSTRTATLRIEDSG